MPDFKSDLSKMVNSNARKAPKVGENFLGDVADMAKRNARTSTKMPNSFLRDVSSMAERTKDLTPVVERRTAGRLSNSAYEALRDAGSGTRKIPTKIPPLKADLDFLSRSKEAMKAFKPNANTTSKLLSTAKTGSSGWSSAGKLASKVAGRVAVPLMIAGAAYDIGKTGYEGYKAYSAGKEADENRASSESKYGDPYRATTTRRSNAGIAKDWSFATDQPKNYVELRKPSNNDFGW